MRIRSVCPVCDDLPADDTEQSVADHISGEVFTRVTCRSCGCQFIADPPSPDTIGKYYQNPSGEMMWSSRRTIHSVLRERSYGRDLNAALRQLPAGSSIIDFGAGGGGVSGFLQARGFDVLALDQYDPELWRLPAVPYRRVNLSGGHLSPTDLLAPSGKPQELAVLRHVLEHLHEPRKVIACFAEAGVRRLVVAVPNADSRPAKFFGEDWYYWDPPRHLTFFNRSTLTALLRRGGYAAVEYKEYGIDEVFVSFYRRLLLRTLNRRGPLARISISACAPTGPLSALSSALSFRGSTVCWCLAQIE